MVKGFLKNKKKDGERSNKNKEVDKIVSVQRDSNTDLNIQKVQKQNKHNKTFSLRSEHVEFLESIDRKSTFMGMLIEGYQNGQFIQPETVAILKKYKALIGANPEETIQRVLGKRVSRIENNMKALKDSAPAEMKNRVGGAFLKLNRAYDALVLENEKLDNKLAITFGLMFKKTGCNHQSIRGWIRANKERLDEYHQKIGVDDPSIHNRQVGVIKRVKWQKAEAEKEQQKTLIEKEQEKETEVSGNNQGEAS